MSKRPYRRDPVTGDELTRAEYASWLIQGIIRRWTLLILLTIVTIVVWVTRNERALTWWNLGASYYAIVIETIVGIAVFGQTRRDAVVLREVRSISSRTEHTAAHLDSQDELIVQILERVERQFEHLQFLQETTRPLAIANQQQVDDTQAHEEEADL